MSFNYSGIAATATRLLGQFGQTATHVQTVVGGSSTTTTGTAVEVQISEGERSRAALAGTPIPARKYLVSAAITPTKGARLTVGALVGIVLQADAIRPGNTVLAWTVGVQAG